jgi:hypothetical protein
MDNKWVCSDCSKILNCRYLKWTERINKLYTNPNRIIVECKHYEREVLEK